MHNPYASNPIAESNSCYLKSDESGNTHGSRIKLVRAAGSGNVQPICQHIHDMFRAMVVGSAFPCLMGKTVFNRQNYRFGVYESLTDSSSILGLCHDLYHFVSDQTSILAADYSTFVTCYLNSHIGSEIEFETSLWNLLQQLHDNDVQHFRWDHTTDPDPKSSRFSFSICERAYFLVGMHPHSSRFSRRFPYPVVVFNAHHQFERLRAEGKFQLVQQRIREQDIKLQGSINPSLTNYGDDSEAKQYSGRLVEPDWECPFQNRGGP